MQKKAMAAAFLAVLVVLAVCVALYGQDKIQLYTAEGTIPSPNYVKCIADKELADLLKCRYFPEASCTNCGSRLYQSDNFGVVSKQNFEQLRSWFFNAMKNDMGGLQDHQVLRMFDAVLALSQWRTFACGLAFRESKTSLPYVYAVLLLVEDGCCGEMAVYRMTAGGVLSKMTAPDRQVHLVVFP